MATLSSLPADLKPLGGRVPADILARLSQAELRHRVRHAKHLQARARLTPVRESMYALAAHADKILRSVPVVEHIEERRKLAHLMSTAPNSQMWRVYFDTDQAHKESSEYPPGLLDACDRVLRGQAVLGDNELAATAEACVNHYKPEK
jgi:hypothetical protein